MRNIRDTTDGSPTIHEQIAQKPLANSALDPNTLRRQQTTEDLMIGVNGRTVSNAESREHPCPKHRVSLIIPTLNEARGLQRMLPALPRWIDELIIVDGGSSDDTITVANTHCPHAQIIRQTSHGKGGALKEGIRAATGSIIVTMDADGSMDPLDINAAIQCLLEGADFVKGSRELRGGGSSDFTLIRRTGNRALTTVANLLFGRRWTDITYGLNAYWRSIIVDLDSLSDGFEFEIQAAARAARTGLRTMEISCYEAPRVGGHSKLSPMRDGWFILLLLLNEAKPRTPTSFRACADWHLGKDAVIDLRLDPPSPSITLLETAV